MFDAARHALTEFGGLKVDVDGPGVDFAKGSFQLDPSLAIGEEDRFDVFEKRLASRLYPLGEAYGGHTFLAIDDQGSVFLLMGDVRRIGRSIGEALEGLILGKKMCD